MVVHVWESGEDEGGGYREGGKVLNRSGTNVSLLISGTGHTDRYGFLRSMIKASSL